MKRVTGDHACQALGFSIVGTPMDKAKGSMASVAFCCDTTFPPPQHNPPGGGGGATPTSPGLGGQPNLPPGYMFGQVDGDPGTGPALDPYNFGNGGLTHSGCC